ncbi:MAG: hypothetical protein IJI25_02135 [Eubacterium sp.]|nr:hypothetical protein [Eubacterium sp.]
MKTLLFKKVKVMAAVLAMAVMAIGLAVPGHAAKKKTTVYVITQIKGLDDNGATENFKMSYNDKGLVTETKMGSAKPVITKHSYKNGKISSEVQIEDGEKTVINYSYNKKGQIARRISTDPKGKKTVITYSYKNGKLAQIKDGDVGITYTFTYKKNLVSQMVITGKTLKKQTIKYKYNSKKEIKKIEFSDVVQNMTYKYKNNRWQTLKVSYRFKEKANKKYDYNSTYTYTYKKLRVPASMASKIKEQQESIANQGGAFLYVF